MIVLFKYEMRKYEAFFSLDLRTPQSHLNGYASLWLYKASKRARVKTFHWQILIYEYAVKANFDWHILCHVQLEWLAISWDPL